KLASAFAEGVEAEGCVPRVICLKSTDRSEVMRELMNAGALAVGSCTMNNGIFPTVADCMTYIKGLKPQNILGAIFGSYGWNLLAFEELKGYFEKAGIPLVIPNVQAKMIPDEEKLLEAYESGRTLAKELNSKIS
ncbi:FprA family A-type flavoprotein, partial [bacterium]|nr:FprA family A-type flavoprotein [bacterium]